MAAVSVGWLVGQFPSVWELLPHLMLTAALFTALYALGKFLRAMMDPHDS